MYKHTRLKVPDNITEKVLDEEFELRRGCTIPMHSGAYCADIACRKCLFYSDNINPILGIKSK